MNYKHLKQNLEEAKLFFQPEFEKTIFSVGGRGYYENPISDLLAFFFNPQEAHGFGSLFLDSFFEALNLSDTPQSRDLVGTPKREVSTVNGKRIDLLLEGDDWVLVIENKVYHNQCNPFSEYESFISSQYKKNNSIFVILSPKGRSKSKNWVPLSYKSFVKSLKNNIGDIIIDSEYGKWVVYLRDFIINLEEYAVRYDMDAKAIDFVENNYQTVYELVMLRNKYINHIQKSGLDKLNELFPEQKFSTTIHNWRSGPAIRFYSESWVGKSNLVIQIGHKENSKGIGIYMYAYNVPEISVSNADDQLRQNNKYEPWTESKSIRCYRSSNRHTKYDDALKEFEKTAQVFNAFNEKRKTKPS